MNKHILTELERNKMFDYKVFKSSNETVSKYVFTCPTAVAEAVLYQYKTRTVICCSTQSGCPVGCTFCGTGKRFVRNLTSEEIVEQVDTVIMDSKTDVSEIQKFQIMFMSMGEPLLNWDNVKEAIYILNSKYPKAQLLLSTIAPRYKNDEIIKDVIMVAKDIDKVGLQFSIHKSTDEQRSKLIPYRNKYTLEEIAEFGKEFCLETGRNPYLNYCVDGTNNTETDADNLKKLFIPEVFCFTFSVVCSSDETMKEASYRNLESIRNFEQLFMNDGYNTRIFDPAGQDDIGGGCGQLWYTQKWIKEHRKKKYRPFDPATFEQHYDIGSVIEYRRKDEKNRIYKETIESTERNYNTNEFFYVEMGEYTYTLGDLFEDFELFENGEWKPFGVVEE